MTTLETVRSYSSTFLGLGTQLGISISISVYCLLQFEWNRRKKSMQYLYSPRTKLTRNPSPPIPSGLFSWIKTAISLSDEFYLENVGLDALMYIRFLRMAFQFVLFNVIIVGVILIPINYLASQNEVGVPKLSLSNINPENTDVLWAHVVCTYIVSVSWMFILYKNYYDYMVLHRKYFIKKVLSGSITERTVMISRIPRELRSEDELHKFVSNLGLGEVESARMVRHTGKLDRKIARREKALLSLEKAHVQLAKNVCNAIKRRRLLGTGIWARLFGYTNDLNNLNIENGEAREAREHQKIQTFVDRLGSRKRRHMNTNESVSENHEVAIRHSRLPTSGTFSSNDLMDREDGYGRQFLIWNSLRQISKDILDKYQPTHRTGFFFNGSNVVSIDNLLKKFNYLDRRIAELRSKSIQEDPYKATSTGFVTFKDHISAQLCAQSIMYSKPHTCTTKMAPEPRDILWDNLKMKFKEKLIRYIIINACVWALIIFWLFPIVAFLTLTSIDSLSKKIKFLGPFLDAAPTIRTLLQNVLPTVLVTFFMLFLPWILMELSKQEGFSSYSELEEAVLIRFYHFSFFNVFIVFLLGYTFLQSIFDVIQKPTSILDILAVSLPRGATFFINYIIFNSCTHGLELIQVGSQLFLHIILTSQFIATTPRMLQRVTHPWAFQFYYYYPNHILIFVITITYSVINPLILVFSLIYYAIALVVFKHQFAYCYVRRYEAGGKFYRRVFRYTTDGLIIFQLTIIGTFWLRKGIAQGAVIIPLVVATGYFKYYCRKTFYSRTHYLALDSRLCLQNSDIQNEQSNQRVDSEKTAGGKSSATLPESSHAEKENDESDAKIKGKIKIATTKDGFSELIETDSETSTKIAFSKNNGITKDTFESDVNDSQNEEIIHNKQSMEKVRKSAEKSRKKQSSLSQPVIVILNEQDGGSASTNGADGNEASDTVLNNNINIPVITGSKDNNNDNSSSSSRVKKKVKELTIIPPEGRERGKEFLNGKFTSSPIEISGHALRLPSAGNLRSFHPAHFTHDPNYKVLQDETSTYQTYTHPNLVKALNRKLWLPRNPLKKICLEENVELSKALTSSDGGTGIVGYWGGASQYLGEARVSIYGNHEFPKINEGEEEGDRDQNQNARKCSKGNQNTDNEEDDEESEYCSDENIVSLNAFISGELAPGELSSGEEF